MKFVVELDTYSAAQLKIAVLERINKLSKHSSHTHVLQGILKQMQIGEHRG